jgi:hypothetical protein
MAGDPPISETWDSDDNFLVFVLFVAADDMDLSRIQGYSRKKSVIKFRSLK